MRSGTSCFDWTVFKKTVTRFWPLWGAYLAVWLVILPLNGLMLLRMAAGAAGRGEYGFYMENFAMQRVPMAAAGDMTLALSVVFGALCAMAVFSHLYNARPANLFGSLPIRREGLFITHYLAGLLFLVVPNVVIFLLTLLVETIGGCVYMPGLLFWLGVSCGEGFLFYSMAVFCAMFTGHILALPAFYAVLNGLVAGVTTLVELMLHSFYYGFYGFTEAIYNVIKWFTPVVRLGEGVRADTYSSVDNVTGAVNFNVEIYGPGTVGVYALVAAVLTVGAFFLYRARRLESAGDVVAVKVMRPVFKYGVALCAGLALGTGTAALTGGGKAMLMAAIVVWGVIGYFAAQMLLDKSFRVFKKWKGAVAIAAVFAAVFLVVGLDLTGFETRIPDPAQVDSVCIYGMNAVYLSDDGDFIREDTADPEIIRLATLLHQEAVAQQDGNVGVGGVSNSLTLTYTLKGGGILSRRYAVWLDPAQTNQEGTAAWAVQQIYNNRELYWQAYGFARLEKALSEGSWRLERATRANYAPETGAWAEAAFYGQDAAALLAAVKEDFFAGRIAVRRVDDEENWLGRTQRNTLSFTAEDQGDDGVYYISITLQDGSSSTWAALEEMADRAVRTGEDTYPRDYAW